MTTQRLTSILAALALAACGTGYSGGDGDGDGDGGPDPDCSQDSPETGGLVINEMMASNAVTLRDDEGNSHDWIELHNVTDREISLCGWRLTRELEGSNHYVIAHENVVPAGGQVLLHLTTNLPPASDRVPLFLGSEVGEIGLLAPDGSFSDRLVYGAQATDFSAARQPDGGETWEITWHVTPGEPNSDEAPVIHVEDPSQPPEMVPAAGDLTGELLGYDRLPEIGLSIDDDGIESLRDRPYQWVPGSIIYRGREYGPVGIRLKGQNSFQPIDQKPSFRINIDEYVDPAKFFQLDDLTLNNMNDDFSMMHERLAYLVARQLGPASRSNHAVVTLNGEHYGLYANVETVKHHMLARWFEDSGGSLYEGTDVDFRDDLIPYYEHESGIDDRTILFDISAALDNADADAAIAQASAYIDMDSFWNYWAMCAIVGQYDAFPYSAPGDDYFIYIDPLTGKLSILPWGMDETFYSSSFPIDQVSSRLAVKCADSAGCYQEFVDRTWAALDMMEQMDLAGERTRVASEIAPYVAADSRKPYSDADVAEFQEQLRYFIEGRRLQLSEQLPPPSGSGE